MTHRGLPPLKDCHPAGCCRPLSSPAPGPTPLHGYPRWRWLLSVTIQPMCRSSPENMSSTPGIEQNPNSQFASKFADKCCAFFCLEFPRTPQRSLTYPTKITHLLTHSLTHSLTYPTKRDHLLTAHSRALCSFDPTGFQSICAMPTFPRRTKCLEPDYQRSDLK